VNKRKRDGICGQRSYTLDFSDFSLNFQWAFQKTDRNQCRVIATIRITAFIALETDRKLYGSHGPQGVPARPSHKGTLEMTYDVEK
jgi:hypothetical protein